jgi:hypothetical protein
MYNFIFFILLFGLNSIAILVLMQFGLPFLAMLPLMILFALFLDFVIEDWTSIVLNFLAGRS